MKSNKILLTALLLALLVIGWLAAVKAANSTEAIDTQNALVIEADELAGKELYVRAIPKYKEALQYSTDNNNEIEGKLLNAYYAFGQTDSYVSLTETRAAKNIANAEEYLRAAEIYIENGKLEKAVELLKKGIKNTSSDELINYYEANRYSYSMRTTGYQYIQPTIYNSTMPAYDGTEWCYIDDHGRRLDSWTYTYAAIPNRSGYTVVRRDDGYYMLDSEGYKYGVDQLGLSEVISVTGNSIIGCYENKYGFYDCDFELMSDTLVFDEIIRTNDNYCMVKRDNKWGIADIASFTVCCDFLFDEAAINSTGAVFFDGAGMVKYSGEWYLITPYGNKLIESSYKDAKAPESADGYIAVSDESGKWGFIDREGKLVIDYKYDDAYSFSNDLAAVEIDGSWHYISKRDEIVIDISMIHAYPFHNGVAQIELPDGIALLTLDIFDN